MHLRAKLLAALFVLSQAGPAWSCSCVPMSMQQATATTPVVFEGRVIDTRTIESERSLVARVIVVRRTKGSVRKHVSVVTSSASTLCGYPLAAGDVLTFGGAFDRRGRLATNMCLMVPLNPVGRR